MAQITKSKWEFNETINSTKLNKFVLLSVTINKSINVKYVNLLPYAHRFLRLITLNQCGAMEKLLVIKEEYEYSSYKIVL